MHRPVSLQASEESTRRRQTPRRPDPFPCFPVPFAALPLRCRRVRPLTVTQRFLAESPFFGGCESRVCSNGSFTGVGLAGSVRAGQAKTQVSNLAPAYSAAGESAMRGCSGQTNHRSSLPKASRAAAMLCNGPAESGPCLQCKLQESPSHSHLGLQPRTRAGRTGWGTTAQ
jgi:hypothetical protein